LAGATAAAFVAGALFAVTGSASASPAPTLGQVQAKLSKLETQFERLVQQYDQVQQQYNATHQRLQLVDKQLAGFNAQFSQLRAEVARIAVTAYEHGNINPSITLLTSGNPQQVLSKSSILLELSASDNARITQFLDAARQLTSARRLASRTQAGTQELKNGLAKRRTALAKLVSQQKVLVAQLTPAQQATTGAGGPSVTQAKYTGPTATQAQKAVAFAYGQLGCPYVFGGTGPCNSGFDCSGLTSQAWAHAGISIPRVSYDQWNLLPHVSQANLQPGDILVFNGAGHVGIYVGHGKLIDALHSGLPVELVPFSGWYQQVYDGAVRP
jgi:peptidoglycan DL-endopeptidase CwlO